MINLVWCRSLGAYRHRARVMRSRCRVVGTACRLSKCYSCSCMKYLDCRKGLSSSYIRLVIVRLCS